MNSQELRSTLDISSGTLTLTSNTLGAGFGELLTTCYQGQPLTITQAAVGQGDGVDSTVVITGRASFLNAADLPVTARFSVGDDGQVMALVRYQLRDDAPGPAAWTFSRSFPRLPKVWNYATGIPGHGESKELVSAQKPYVDALDLFGTGYVVSTHARKDPESGADLKRGINLVSRMRPQQLLGVFGAALGGTEPLMLQGSVQLPQPTGVTVGLLPEQRPWERPDAPGIHLQSSLPLDFKVGKLVFDQVALRAYTPPSVEWLQQNPSFLPTHGYTGRLSIPSADITVELSTTLEWNLPRAFLFAQCHGVTLRKLTQLVDLAGTDSLAAMLPDELKAAVEKLEQLELIDVGLGVSLAGLTPTVDRVMITVGMPKLAWKVWDDNLVVESISCRFDISRPFTPRSSTAVTLMGTIKIEGVPVEVGARSDTQFSLYARLENAETIPLTSLMKTYAPGVPPPSDLTVNSVALTLSPGRSYAMSMVLADGPKPWQIPVGRSNIVIKGVMFDFSYLKGGQVKGSFSGTASLGKTLSLDARLDVPGGFAIRGSFPKVNLTQLVDELCDQKVPLPSGFDFILEDASVLVQKQNDSYALRAGTTVKDFGTFAFETRKVPGQGWGFAAGLNMGSAGLSAVPGLGGLKSIENSFKLQKLMLVVSSFEDAGFTFPDMAQFNQPQLGTGKFTLPAQATGVIPGLMLFAEWQLDSNDKQQNLIKGLLGLGGTQSATVAIGADPMKDFRLFVSQQSKIQGNPLQCKFGIQLSAGKPSFFLTGTLATRIQGQTQNFDLTTVFVPGGAFMSATMKGATAVNCGPFKLSNLALQMGVNWGGIPSLGIAATIDVKNFQSSLAVFLDSTDPSRSLVAGSISNLSLKDIVDSLLGVAGLKTPLDDVLKTVAIKGTHEFSLPGDLSDELDGLDFGPVSSAFAAAKVPIPSSSQQLTLVVNKKGSSWHLTDLSTMRHYELEKKDGKIQVQIAPQFYFAPQPTFIGSIKYPQGYYLSAAISFAGFDASATIDISQSKGFAVDAQMDKIVIADENLFSIRAAQGGGGPKISISTFNQPTEPVAEFRAPHFYINGSLTMLGVKRSVFASVTTQGIDFELKGQLVPGVDFDLDARFGKAGIGANGKVKVGVGTVDLGALGKAKINTQLEVEVDIDIDNRGRDVSVGKDKGWSPGATLLQNELATLVYQGDGNLVLYKTTGTSSQPIWASNTSGQSGGQMFFQGDGNLVMYRNGSPIWASGSNAPGVTTLTLKGDGNLIIHDGSGNVKWSTGNKADGGGPSIEMESSFDFAGQHINIGKFRLEAKADTFNKLQDIVSKKVEEALRDVFNDMNKWADAVAKGAMDGVNDTAKVFKDVYKKSDKEAKELAKNVSKGTTQATKAVENVAKDVGKSTQKAIKKVKFW